jgi:hypothetical protein
MVVVLFIMTVEIFVCKFALKLYEDACRHMTAGLLTAVPNGPYPNPGRAFAIAGRHLWEF